MVKQRTRFFYFLYKSGNKKEFRIIIGSKRAIFDYIKKKKRKRVFFFIMEVLKDIYVK